MVTQGCVGINSFFICVKLWCIGLCSSVLAVRGTSASVTVRNDSKMQVSYLSICNALVESDFGEKKCLG